VQPKGCAAVKCQPLCSPAPRRRPTWPTCHSPAPPSLSRLPASCALAPSPWAGTAGALLPAASAQKVTDIAYRCAATWTGIPGRDPVCISRVGLSRQVASRGAPAGWVRTWLATRARCASARTPCARSWRRRARARASLNLTSRHASSAPSHTAATGDRRIARAVCFWHGLEPASV